MSTYNSQRSRSDEANTRATDEARTFKKTEQVVGKPETTDHDIHEDILKGANTNRPEGWEVGGTKAGAKAPKQEEVYPTPEGTMGEDPILGRQKPLDMQTASIDDSETATRNPSV